MPDNVVDLIMNDHRQVEMLFAQLKTEPDKRANLLPVLTTLLTAHSRAEEAEVYPAAREEAGIGEDVEHSQEEHLLADQILTRLAGVDPTSAEFEPVLDELIEAITHHVEEEEAKVLPGMRTGLDEQRLAQLGEAFLASREEHLGEQVVDLRRDEMLIQARNAGIEGASSMTKAQLEKELAAHADS